MQAIILGMTQREYIRIAILNQQDNEKLISALERHWKNV